MPTVLHSSLTGADSHEPKGIDSASARQFYLSDGTGSGNWRYSPLGWGIYKDSKTGASVQTINTTASLLQNDGAGSSTSVDYLPPEIRGSGNLWDTVNDKITPMAIGDSYELRLDINIAAKSGSPNELTITLDIGGTGTGITVNILERYINTTKAPPYKVSVGFPIYCLSTFVTNGGQFYLATDTGTLDINEVGIFLNRTFCGEFG